MRRSDEALGLGRPIERRDFLQGMLIGTGGALMGELSPVVARAAALEAVAQDKPDYYPPERLGLRGSHPGAFEAAHESLSRAGTALAAGHSELAAEDVRLALRALGQVTGRVDVEQVLDRLFATFCVGK